MIQGLYNTEKQGLFHYFPVWVSNVIQLGEFLDVLGILENVNTVFVPAYPRTGYCTCCRFSLGQSLSKCLLMSFLLINLNCLQRPCGAHLRHPI